MFHKLTKLYQENRDQGRLLLFILSGFLVIYFIPAGTIYFDNAVLEAIRLTNWYAQEHVILCLFPAFIIAGAMAVYISQGSVLRYLGPQASKPIALSVASVSGSLLAVCSCTVLPLFGGIYKRGAGLGAAIAFLYSGPAINVMAIVVTAKVLGPELGMARALGAIVFAVIIGAIMHLIYRREESERAQASTRGFEAEEQEKPFAAVVTFFALMIGILVFANWANPQADDHGIWIFIYSAKWYLSAGFLILSAGMLTSWFKIEERNEWVSSSWGFAKQIMPLLLIGVLIAGLLLGRPGEEGLIPSWIIENAVGGNSLAANFFASIAGAFMYFATLTEVPILQGLISSGMGKGPALALLLAGPALSLPNMLVIRGVIGTRKTFVYVSLVVVMATISGIIFGNIAG